MRTALFFPRREFERYGEFNQADDRDKVTQIYVGSDVALMYNHTINRIADQGFLVSHGGGQTTEAKGKKAFKRALTSHLALMIWEQKVGHFGLDLPIYNSANISTLANLQGGLFLSAHKKSIQIVIPDFASDVFDEPVREHRVFTLKFAYEYSLVKWLLLSGFHSHGLTDDLTQRLEDADRQITYNLNRIRGIIGGGH